MKKTFSTKNWPILLPALLLAAAGMFLGCDRQAPTAKAMELPVAQVKIQMVSPETQIAFEEITGTVRSKFRATVEAKISGRIQSMPVTAGQLVHAGDLLAELDAREIQARVNQALATRDQAEIEFNRAAALLESQAGTQMEYDAARSRLRVVEAALEEALTLLGFSRVTAPFAGRIVRKLAEAGELAAPGKPLLEMEDPEALRFDASVPEGLIGAVELGDILPVRISAADVQLEGRVAEMIPAADPGSRTFLVKLDLPSASGLRSGQFGRVSIPAGESASLWVPASAVIQRGQMELVYVAVENRARLRLVRTGRRSGGQVEVLSGLVSGENVVVENAAVLRDGQEIRQ